MLKRGMQYAAIGFAALISAGCTTGTAESWKTVYDEYRPDFHGVETTFRKPMVYITVTEDHKDEVVQDAIDIGRYLITEEDHWESYSFHGHKLIERIRSDMVFTIESSYLVKKDWLTGTVTDNYKQMILKDENGVRSVALLVKLNYSNHPELYSLMRAYGSKDN